MKNAPTQKTDEGATDQSHCTTVKQNRETSDDERPLYWPLTWRTGLADIPGFRIHGVYDVPATGRRLRRLQERAAAKAERRAKS